MPKNIVDAYRKAVSKNYEGDFRKVVSFCDSDKKCRSDVSLKKKILMFWSYKKIAKFYEDEKKYEKAYEFWLKALEIAVNSAKKIVIGYQLLRLMDKMNLSIPEKAQEIIKITTLLQREYEKIGEKESVLRISKLQDAAQKLLKKSNTLH